MAVEQQQAQTLAAFVLENGAASQRLLEAVQKVDSVDDNVKVVDAAIAERTKFRGRVKVHQTKDMGAMKGGVHGAAIGVVVGALVAGPAGAVAAGAAGGLLHSLRSRFHDIGIDDKWMREVSKEIDKGKSVLFVQYEGSWAASIGLIENAIKAENALLIQSTLPPSAFTRSISFGSSSAIFRAPNRWMNVSRPGVRCGFHGLRVLPGS